MFLHILDAHGTEIRFIYQPSPLCPPSEAPTNPRPGSQSHPRRTGGHGSRSRLSLLSSSGQRAPVRRNRWPTLSHSPPVRSATPSLPLSLRLLSSVHLSWPPSEERRRASTSSAPPLPLCFPRHLAPHRRQSSSPSPSTRLRREEEPQRVDPGAAASIPREKGEGSGDIYSHLSLSLSQRVLRRFLGGAAPPRRSLRFGTWERLCPKVKRYPKP